MDAHIRISSEIYRLLQRRAREAHSTPEAIAETVLRLQLGNTIHIEQRQTAHGAQAYLRGTRIAVRHVAAFLKAGRSAEDIIRVGLSHLPPASIYEAIAYYYDHQPEIDAELNAQSEQAVYQQIRGMLSPEQYAQLTGQAV